MIQIKNKNLCCGCSACAEICPARCITMRADEEGFQYPIVDINHCLNCGLCDTACPMQNITKKKAEPLSCFAAQAIDPDLRRGSSSGGIFPLLAERILQEDGVVFGARFDKDFRVIHSYAISEDDVSGFWGSKYSQSDINHCFNKAEGFLKEGKKVLFSGTPCQIAGLKGFLRKEYEGLYTVSIVCHGAPSPRIWHDFLRYTLKGETPLKVSFRNKETGWKDYSMEILGESKLLYRERAASVSFMKAFLQDLIIRPSCYSCPFRGNHGSDLTLGDFWGIENVHPDLDDDKGTSIVLVYTARGEGFTKGLDWLTRTTSYSAAVNGNPSMMHNHPVPHDREALFRKYQKKGYSAVVNYYKPSVLVAIKKKIRSMLFFVNK